MPIPKENDNSNPNEDHNKWQPFRTRINQVELTDIHIGEVFPYGEVDLAGALAELSDIFAEELEQKHANDEEDLEQSSTELKQSTLLGKRMHSEG